MPYRKSKGWGNTKPSCGVPLADSSCLLGLQFFLNLNEGGGTPHDSRPPGYVWTLNNSPTWASSTQRFAGHVMNFPNGGTAFISGLNANYPDAPFLGALTIMWCGMVRTGSAFRAFIGKCASNGGVNNPFDFRTDNSATPKLDLVRANATGAMDNQSDGPAITLNLVQTYCVTAPTDISLANSFYIDGKFQASLAPHGSQSGAPTGSGNNIDIGRRPDGAVQMDGYCEWCAVWSRQLTATEILRMHVDPFHIFATPRRRIISGAAAAAGYSDLLAGGAIAGGANLLGNGTLVAA